MHYLPHPLDMSKGLLNPYIFANFLVVVQLISGLVGGQKSCKNIRKLLNFHGFGQSLDMNSVFTFSNCREKHLKKYVHLHLKLNFVSQWLPICYSEICCMLEMNGKKRLNPFCSTERIVGLTVRPFGQTNLLRAVCARKDLKGMALNVTLKWLKQSLT